MSSQVLVALLVTVVLGDVVEVFTADDDGAVHLGGHNTAGQDTATDGDETGEGALLVCMIDSVSGLMVPKGYSGPSEIFNIAGHVPESGQYESSQAAENRGEDICFREFIANA